MTRQQAHPQQSGAGAAALGAVRVHMCFVVKSVFVIFFCEHVRVCVCWQPCGHGCDQCARVACARSQAAIACTQGNKRCSSRFYRCVFVCLLLASSLRSVCVFVRACMRACVRVRACACVAYPRCSHAPPLSIAFGAAEKRKMAAARELMFKHVLPADLVTVSLAHSWGGDHASAAELCGCGLVESVGRGGGEGRKSGGDGGTGVQLRQHTIVSLVRLHCDVWLSFSRLCSGLMLRCGRAVAFVTPSTSTFRFGPCVYVCV